MPLIHPPAPGSAQAVLPKNVQEILALYEIDLEGWGLVVADDGSPVSSAESVGRYVGHEMVAQIAVRRGTLPRLDDLIEVVAVTTATMEKNKL